MSKFCDLGARILHWSETDMSVSPKFALIYGGVNHVFVSLYLSQLSISNLCARYRVMHRWTECHSVFVRLHRARRQWWGTRVKPDEVWQHNLIKPPMDIVPASNPILDARPYISAAIVWFACKATHTSRKRRDY